MSDAVNHWKPSGTIILWTFRQQNKNYYGWHLTADAAGCESFIDLLDKMNSTSLPVKRTVPLDHPDHFPFSGIGGPFKWSDHVFAQKLKLIYSSTLLAESWEATYSDGVFQLSIGARFLSRLRAGIVDIKRGEGDYSIGPWNEKKPEDMLWFWWYIST